MKAGSLPCCLRSNANSISRTFWMTTPLLLRACQASPSSGEVCLEVCSRQCSLCLHLFFSTSDLNFRFWVSDLRSVFVFCSLSVRSTSEYKDQSTFFQRKGSLTGKAVVPKTTALVACRFDSCPFRQIIADCRFSIGCSRPMENQSAIGNQKSKISCRCSPMGRRR